MGPSQWQNTIVDLTSAGNEFYMPAFTKADGCVTVFKRTETAGNDGLQTELMTER